METLIHADIFFIVTTAAVVLLTIGLVIAIIYLIRILKNVRDISDTVREESAGVAEDVRALRSKIRENTFSAAAFGTFMKSLFIRGASRKKKRPLA